ncbi:S8 family peptidase [Paenibacillus durus]|uniref:S8 family peptidase n=1 Tax=Paenibacillus durus TaxID=44251 RepID=UPI00130DD89E|nr:S8 family peptidase [Paenibacillus durus]
MSDEKYPAKLVSLRPSDFEYGRTPVPIPAPARWEYETREQIVRHFQSLIYQLKIITQTYLPTAKAKLTSRRSYAYPIVLKMNKLAKSHRPDQILKELSSEVIAVHALGKIIVAITEDYLKQFIIMIDELIKIVPKKREDWIVWGKSKSGAPVQSVEKEKNREYDLIHELTCIDVIQAYSANEVLEAMGAEDYKACEKDGEFKVRFFSYDDQMDREVLFNFTSYFHHRGLENQKINRLKYSHNLSTYTIPYVNQEIIQQMASFPGVESISSFTRFRVTNANLMQDTQVLDVVQPEQGKTYPKVALVDSGIGSSNAHLAPWIESEEVYVPFNRQDNYHGEFVGGLLIYAHLANPFLKDVVDTGVKVLDVIVLPNKKYESIREDDLIDALEDALRTYSKEFRVWNLSLGSSRLCSGMISEFTASIDELQDRFKVSFVIAAGNYMEMRNVWPIKDPFLNEMDRISLPADSIRAITVGAVAYNNDSTNLVSKGEAVPYSRRGPGVGLSIKPDVVHYSGNPDNFPIHSIDTFGHIVSDYGTSFSVPLVSAVLAECYEQFPGTLTKTMAKALLLHGSKHPATKKYITTLNDHYLYGFGLPRRINDVLYGNEHEITLIFEGKLNPTQNRNWIRISDFPFPESLHDGGKIRGEILATVVYEPHLNPQRGSEYCRANLDFRLRTSRAKGGYDTITKGSSAGEGSDSAMWEKDQMTRELKWSAAKQFVFKAPRGREGSSDIRLELYPTWRNLSEKKEIPFAIVITIRDPKKEAPVYNDVSKALLMSFQSNDVKLRYEPTRISSRGRS